MNDVGGERHLARAQRFVDEQVKPAVRRWENEGRYPREIVASSGLTGLFVPADAGGSGLTVADAVPVFEQLGRGDPALAFSMSMHNVVASAVVRYAADAAQEQLASRLATGEILGGFALTEPHAGSDAAAITTRAVRTAAGWQISGRKAWVSLASEADLFLVVAKTELAPGHRDIAVFAVDAHNGGVTFPTLYDKACAAHLPIGEMSLDAAPGRLVVPPGEGMRAALGAIDVARCGIAAIATGLHGEVIEYALRYARDRTVSGQRVLDFQGIQWALADSDTELHAGRFLTRAAAQQIGTAEGSVAVAHAKRYCPDAALRAAVLASEVLGAYGWLSQHPLARGICLAKMLQVVDGTAEVQRVIISRDLVRRAGRLQ